MSWVRYVLRVWSVLFLSFWANTVFAQYDIHFPIDGLQLKSQVPINDVAQPVPDNEMTEPVSDPDDGSDDKAEVDQAALDRAMCSEEYTWQESETRYRTKTRTERSWGSWEGWRLSTRNPLSGFRRYSYSSNMYWEGVSVGQYGDRAQNGDTKIIGDYEYRAYWCHSYWCRINRRPRETTTVSYQEPYTVEVTKKTSQYDWCVSQGYPTKN